MAGRPRSAPGDDPFRALFANAPVGVALCAPDGDFCDVNTTFRDILDGTGIDPDRGNLLDLLRYAHVESDEVVAWREDLDAVSAGIRPVARVQLSLAPPDAAPRLVRATAARIALGERDYLLAHLEDATGRRLERQRLVYLATHDALTGLPNRELVHQRLVAALERSAGTGLPVGVLYLDLDRFKTVNDRHGHHVGDALLAAVGRRLSEVLRAGDGAGRLSGDEFLVVAGDVPDETALGELVRRIEGVLAQPVEITDAADGEPLTGLVPLSVSIGAVLSRPGEQAGPLVRRADAAMYAAKRARRRQARRAPASGREIPAMRSAVGYPRAAVAEHR
jgi:diguanylate cyclase (GGDEF)-like protein